MKFASQIINRDKTKSKATFATNPLLVVAGLLLLFIPLFPKIPLFSPIETYIVRVRPEDLLVLAASLFWFWQLIKGKIKTPFRTVTTWFILAYLLTGLLSVISALFVIKSVPLIPAHILKTTLHLFRYLEYFMLFFIIYSSVRTTKDIKKLLWIMMLALLGVIVYGLGQKYFYWPVYSTMNREFSKGIRLYLTEHARVQSTFAGHYDLAAYLVILLPLNLALIFNQLKNWQRWLLIIVQTLGVWILIMTASRTSFVAYLLASLIVIALFALQKESVKTKFTWFISRITAWSLMILILIWVFGGSLKTRLAQTLEAYPALYEGYQLIDQSFNKSSSQLAIFLNFDQLKFLPTSVQDSTEELDAEESQTADNLSDQDAAVLVPSDERPTRQRPGDVYEDIPDKIQIATQSATGETEYITIEQPRVWSENALEHGLSLAIRLDSLWPRAIRGFLRQPFLGSGYATLNKTSLTDFTIADSTDNNFLRILGETGLLGFLTFFGVILTTLIKALLNLRTNEKLLTSLSIAYIGATMGLLLNAFYIDVFAASKVAFTFWAVTGLLLAYDQLYSLTPTKKTPTKKTKKTRKVKKIQKKEKSL